MAAFKDIAVNDTFSFPEMAPGYGGARLGLCVKVSPRKYQAVGQSTVYTIGTTACPVVARGELETVTALSHRGSRSLA